MSVVLFPFDPDWTDGFTETPEYLTTILPARTGAEQRQQLRTKPRRKISFRLATLDAQETQLFEGIIWNHQAKVFGVPVWSDQAVYSGDLAMGATTIAIDTTTRLFEVGGLAMVWKSPLDCEVQTVSNVAPALLTIGALSKAYTGPVVVTPVLPGRIAPEFASDRPVGTVAIAPVTFACEVV